MGPEALAQVLRHLTTYDHPNLLVGLKTSDDAAVYQLDADHALVQTVDFFPPVVDDPYTYGAIAAANAMSDVYAMGGEVILALNIAAFPDSLPPQVVATIFQGGADKVAEGGGVVAGGHTIIDQEPKYGLSVTGLVHPAALITKAAVMPGDVLFLTKPLGTGVITTAMKGQAASPEDARAATESMLRLNRLASQIAREAGVRGGTDITGFGLLGHASEMAVGSGVRLCLVSAQVPLLDGALGCGREGHWPGGMWRNRRYVLGSDTGRDGPLASVAETVSEDAIRLLCDPQTSGGLLLAVPAPRAEAFASLCRERGQMAWRIGEATGGKGIWVE